jgi:hypothetical protein
MAERMDHEPTCAFGCGNPLDPNSKRLCKKHLQHQRSKMAEFRASRKKLGLCSRCPNPARIVDGQISTLCEDCRTRVREQEKNGRDRQARQLKRVLHQKAMGFTNRQISVKEKLTVEQVKQLLAKGVS